MDEYMKNSRDFPIDSWVGLTYKKKLQYILRFKNWVNVTRGRRTSSMVWDLNKHKKRSKDLPISSIYYQKQ